MSYLGNTPKAPVILRLEQRKSFSLALWIQDRSGRPLDITGATLRIVMKERYDAADLTDSTNLITNSLAELVDAPVGYARFEMQASDFNHDAGEYPYSIVMVNEGYSIVLARGVVELLENTEVSSIGSTYDTLSNASGLTISLDGPRVLNVFTGPALAPGTTSFTNADKTKLDTIQEGAQVNEQNLIPPGGGPRAYLGKASAEDYILAWFQPAQTDPSGLDAAGVTAGQVPTANGADGWDWAASITNADDITDGAVNVMMTLTERFKLESLTLDYTQLDNLPTLGTAAAKNTGDFLPSTGIATSQVTSGVFSNARLPKVSAHLGFSVGTASPTGGSDGDIYYQLEA